jgi:hypothetical protein
MTKDSKKPPNDWPPVPRDIPPRIFQPLAELETRLEKLPELKAQIEATLARYPRMSRAFLLRELEHWNEL